MIDTLESLSVATAGPAPAGDIVATVYKDSSGSALYVEPLPPQSLTCLGPFGGRGRLPGGPGLVRFREHHASAASRRRVALPQPRPRPELGPCRGTLGDGDGEGS